MALTVQLIENESEFFALEQEWNNLLERSQTATIFMTYDWAIAVWKVRTEESHPFILKFYDGATLVGLAPLHLFHRKFGIKVLQFIPMGLYDYCLAGSLDVLSATGYEEQIVETMMTFLKMRSRRWDVFIWSELNETSPSYSTLTRSAESTGLWLLKEFIYPTYMLQLPPTWQEYLNQLSPGLRNSIERRTRKIIRECNATFERVSDIEESKRLMQIMFDYHESRWPEHERYRRIALKNLGLQLACTMIPKGYLDIHVLKVKDTPVAINWDFRFHGTYLGFRTAHSPDGQWSKYSVGTILLAYIIKEAIKDKLSTFDMLQGEFDYKIRFGGKAHQVYWAYITNNPLPYYYYRLRPVLQKVKNSLHARIKHTPVLTRLNASDRDLEN